MITTVAVVSRFRLYQELLSALVGSTSRFAVIDVCDRESEATGSVAAKAPDMALIDAALPGAWNIAEAATSAGVRVIAIGVSDDHGAIEAAERAGCARVLGLAATSHDLVDALEAADECAHERDEPPPEIGIVADLTARELEVLTLVAEGLSNKEIASELVISVPTVKSHVHNVQLKLGTRRRRDAGRLLHAAAGGDAWLDMVPRRSRGSLQAHRGVPPNRSDSPAAPASAGLSTW
jgi:DNA-binding NarL/FixJ family response regulator